jgi:hypothetical protein
VVFLLTEHKKNVSLSLKKKKIFHNWGGFAIFLEEDDFFLTE